MNASVRSYVIVKRIAVSGLSTFKSTRPACATETDNVDMV